MINYDETTGKVTFKGVDYVHDIWYPNFSGTPSDYNTPKGEKNPRGELIGKRSFTVLIRDPADAEFFMNNRSEAGNPWNIKEIPPKSPNDAPFWKLEVVLKYKNPKYAPIIFTKNDEDVECYKTEATVDDLDHLDISTLDFTIRPYDWEFAGKTGRTAELDRMRVNINTLPF